ncbi:hypothetical protein RDWZM_001654 [Blomia tropicalis]|uniref:Mediator of RNA polymerase II transcription subunit 30 n=1 Tax=Blomia tropicalis TaxID=40697 RepID=A0A9Q0MCC6_BLOTA|nr:Mediator of RNA polymerase II transcription subunit 30 [Blomia tropicalis]KAJ6223109.1 hypothetical protein RDWZM_001654 [Blomia tropicalis]
MNQRNVSGGKPMAMLQSPQTPQQPQTQMGLVGSGGMIGANGPQQQPISVGGHQTNPLAGNLHNSMATPTPSSSMNAHQVHQQQQVQSKLPMGHHQASLLPPQHPVPGGNQMPSQVQPQQPMGVNQPVTLLCRFGADFVQEICCKSLDLLQHLRTMGVNQCVNNPAQQEDRKTKIKECMYHINLYMRRVRLLHDRVGDFYQQAEYAINTPDLLENIIPLIEDDQNGTGNKDDSPDENLNKDKSHSYDYPKIPEERLRNNSRLQALQTEHAELTQLAQLKNRQLKEIIDHLRKLVWDINSMLSMRKS